MKEEAKDNKRTFENYKKSDSMIIKAILTLILLIIIVLTFLGSYSNFNGQGTIPAYKFADIFTPYDQYILRPSSSVVQTDAYVDKDGNTVRKVPVNTDSLTNINLGTTNNEELAKNNQVTTSTVDDEVANYKIEKREIADNDSSVLNRSSFEKSQEIIINSLKANGLNDFRVRRNFEDGTLIFEVPQVKEKTSILEKAKDTKEQEDKASTIVESILTTRGTFEASDSKTGRVYLTENDIESITSNINIQGIYLDVLLNQNGKKILSDISRKYIKTEKEDGTIEEHKLDIKISGMILQTASFDASRPVDDGRFQLVLGEYNPEDPDKMSQVYGEIRRLENAIKVGKSPIVYTVEHKYNGVESVLNKENLRNAAIIIAAVVLVISLVFVFKLGIKGIYYLLVMFGYLSVLVIITRFTNIVLSIPALVAILVGYVLQFTIIYKYLFKNNEEDLTIIQIVTNTIKNTFVLLASSIVLSFSTNTLISSFGMILFIAITLLYIVNYIFIKKEDN